MPQHMMQPCRLAALTELAHISVDMCSVNDKKTVREK